MEYGATGNTIKNAFTFNGNRDPFSEKSPFSRGQVFLQGQRSRLNWLGIAMSVFAPWLLFCAVFALLSFRLHYGQSVLCWVLVALAFLFGVAVPGFLAAKQLKSKFTDPSVAPSWAIFLAGTCALAFVLAFSAGEYNYGHFMLPYYDYLNLAVYTDLDTNEFVGQQLMDAGRINFKKGTQLDLTHSMGFRNTDMFCVVPIVTQNSPYKAKTYDFWAVGTNCCSGNTADFHCKGFSDPGSRGALRLVNQWDRPFYRLAVQQAEATYKMTATHPLFFEWVHNADESMDDFSKAGYILYLKGICCELLLQAVITFMAALAFSKLVHPPS